jgi:hypothetical protein
VLEHPMDGVTVLRGWGVCARVAGVGSGKERGGTAVTNTLYRRRGGEWGMGCGRRHAAMRHGEGAWGQRDGRAAQQSWSWLGCGARGWRTRERWWFEYNSNSNEFKLLQNLPNFDQSKNNLP